MKDVSKAAAATARVVRTSGECEARRVASDVTDCLGARYDPIHSSRGDRNRLVLEPEVRSRLGFQNLLSCPQHFFSSVW
jgi:hypothetical protein